MDIFFQIILCSLLVDGIIDLLFSEASIIHIKYIQQVQLALKNYVTNYENIRDFLYKLITCPYCLSFWVSVFVCFLFFNSYLWIGCSFIVWRLSNYFRLFYKYLLLNTVGYIQEEKENIEIEYVEK